MSSVTPLPSLTALEKGVASRHLRLDVQVPADYVSERVLLASMMWSSKVANEARPQLTERDFELPQHKMIFSAIAALLDDPDGARSTDAIAVSARLEADGNLSGCGGQVAIFDMTLEVGEIAMLDWRSALARVLSKSHRRQIAELCAEVCRLSLDDRVPAEALLKTEQNRVLAVFDRLYHDEHHTWEECTWMGRGEILEGNEPNNGVTGLSMGLRGLDDVLLGAHPGEYICIGARPSVGKTSFALAMAAHMASDPEVGVLYFSLEMGGVSLAKKMLLHHMQMDERATLNGGLDRHDGEGYRRLDEACEIVAPLNIEVVDDYDMTLAGLTASARRFFSNYKKGAIFVDYLQLLSDGGGATFGANRNAEVGRISRALKKLALSLGVPVFVLSQLNRQVTARADRRPLTSDLRDSGSIEQDADRILLLDRSLSEDEAAQDERPQTGTFRVDIAKNRQGSQVCVVDLWYDQTGMRFADSFEDASAGRWI